MQFNKILKLPLIVNQALLALAYIIEMSSGATKSISHQKDILQRPSPPKWPFPKSMTYLVDGYRLTRCRTIQNGAEGPMITQHEAARKKSPKWNCIQWKRFLGRGGGAQARFRDETGEIFLVSLSLLSLPCSCGDSKRAILDVTGVGMHPCPTPIHPLSYFSLSSCGCRNVNSCDRCGLHESSIVRTHTSF